MTEYDRMRQNLTECDRMRLDTTEYERMSQNLTECDRMR